MASTQLFVRQLARASAQVRAVHTSKPAAKIYHGGILETIGNTPVVSVKAGAIGEFFWALRPQDCRTCALRSPSH